MSRRSIPPPGRYTKPPSGSSIGGCGRSCQSIEPSRLPSSRDQILRKGSLQGPSGRTSQIRPPGATVQTGAIPKMQPPRRTVVSLPAGAPRISSRPMPPPQAGPIYQKRSSTSTSSGYGIRPSQSFAPRPSVSAQRTNITKVTTKTVEVNKTLRGTQKITKEVTKARPAPPGAPVGTFALPSTSRRETSFMQTRPVIERRVSVDPKRPSQTVPKSILGNVSAKTRLSQQVDRRLTEVSQSNPRKTVIATGAKSSIVRAPVVMVNNVPVSPRAQIVSEKTVEKSPGVEKITRTLVGIEKLSPCAARKTELQMQELEQSAGRHPRSPQKETVSIRTVVSMTDNGQKETDKVVIVEKTGPSQDYPLSPAQVNRMIQEENQDINKSLQWKPIEVVSTAPGSLPLKKQEHESMMNQPTIKSHHESVVIPDQIPDEAPLDEIPPELLAAMIHTEEQGLDMVSEPTHIYTLLFPDDNELGPDVMEVNAAAPAPLDDIAVPSHPLPVSFYNNSVNPDLERAILDTEGQGRRPSAAGFSEYQEKKQPGSEQSGALMEKIKTKHVKKREPQIQAVKPIEEEEPPWPSDEVEDEIRRQERREREIQQQQEQLSQLEKSLADIVGAGRAQPPTECDLQDSFMMGLSSADAVDYILHVEPPTYISKAQLRGSSVPPWFPGYYVAFPEIPELITTVKYPTIALNAAWKHTQPNIFPDDSFLVI